MLTNSLRDVPAIWSAEEPLQRAEESLDDVDNVPLCSLTDFKSTPIFICALSACYRIFPDRGRLETHRLKDHNIDSNTLLWQEVITWDAVRDEEMRKDATVLQATLSVPKSPIPLAGVESSLQSHSDFRKPRFEGLGLSEMVNNAMVIDLSSEEDDDEDSLAVAVEHNEMEITPDINIPGDDESRYLYDVNADPPEPVQTTKGASITFESSADYASVSLSKSDMQGSSLSPAAAARNAVQIQAFPQSSATSNIEEIKIADVTPLSGKGPQDETGRPQQNPSPSLEDIGIPGLSFI